ncbi:MAG: aminoglycoside phosphotransferase family protein, partial [Phenylobacterium sp.]
MLSDFQPWIDRWRLEPDGAPFKTAFGSRLLPVRCGCDAAMLKVAFHEEERRGGAVMAWRGGLGAARVFAFDAQAVV